MESAILLGHRHVSSPLMTFSFTSSLKTIHIPKNPFLSYSCSASRRARNPCSIVSSIRNNNGMNDYDKRNSLKPLKIVKGASLVLACALSIFGCQLMHPNPKALAVPKQLIYQKPPTAVESMIFPIGGKSALKSLLDVSAILGSSKAVSSDSSFNLDRLPSRLSMEDIDSIKMEAVRLMKVGEPEEALNLLYRAHKQYKYQSETAYNIQMALVEILICQGKFEEAAQCKCLDDDQSHPSDVRLHLYKAIINTMLDKEDEAKIWWKAFRKTIGEGMSPYE